MNRSRYSRGYIVRDTKPRVIRKVRDLDKDKENAENFQENKKTQVSYVTGGHKDLEKTGLRKEEIRNRYLFGPKPYL